MMNKLGFKITRTNNGLVDICTCNGGEWEKSVIDVRDYSDYFNGIEEIDKFLTFLSFDDNGCFLTQLKSISNRGGDNLCGWIYIPNTIEISKDEIFKAYNFAHDVLSMSDIMDCKEKIDSFFSKPYTAKSTPISYTPSSKEDKYGFIRENVNPSFCSLEDFFKYRYQPEYSQFKAVFFLKSKYSIVEEHYKLFTDLTNHKLKELCVLLDFSDADKKKLHIDKIVDEKGQEVHFPKVYAKDAKVTLYAERKGFERQIMSIVVNKDCQLPANLIRSWEKVISPDVFKIVDKDGKSLSGSSNISINDKPMKNTVMLLTEDECREAKVKIEVHGYESVTKTLNLLKESQPKITLHREEKSETWRIYLKNDKLADMTLKSKELAEYLDSGKSPLAGYSYDEHKKALCVDKGFVWKQRFFGIGGFLLTLAILVGLFYAYQWLESYGTIPSDAEVADTMFTQVEDKPFTDQAIAYMDNNKTWNKDSLHNYMGNDTLYNNINKYNFEYLVGLDASACKSLDEVVKCASKGYDKNLNVKGKFSEDGNITISKWIDKVKKLAEEKNKDKRAEEKKSVDAQNKSADKNAKGRKEQANSKSKQAKGKEQAKEQQKASKSQNTKDAKGTKGTKSAKKSDNQPANGTNKLGQ